MLPGAALQGILDGCLSTFCREDLAKQRGGCQGVSHGPVAVGVLDAQGVAQGAQPVPGQTGDGFARQTNGAQLRPLPGPSHGFKMTSDEGVVKTHVVCHEGGVFQQAFQLVGNGFKRGGILDHGVVDASKCDDARRNGSARIDEGRPLIQHVGAVGPHHGDFRNA